MLDAQRAGALLCLSPLVLGYNGVRVCVLLPDECAGAQQRVAAMNE